MKSTEAYFTEQNLRSAWKRVTGEEPREDEGFLGANSWRAAEFLVEMRHQGCPIVVGDLIDYPSLPKLSAAMEDLRKRANIERQPQFAEIWNSAAPLSDFGQGANIVEIASGAGIPIFFVFHDRKDINRLRKIANKFRGDRPVYCLEFVKSTRLRRIPIGIPEMAEHALAQLYRIQPRGPFFIVGYCAGADLAFEMAGRIVRRGEQVGSLILMGALPPGIRRYDPGWGIQDMYEVCIARTQILTGIKDLANNMSRMTSYLRRLEQRREEITTDDFYWFRAQFAVFLFSLNHYIPPPYKGAIHLLQKNNDIRSVPAEWSAIASDVGMSAADVDNFIDLTGTTQFAQAMSGT